MPKIIICPFCFERFALHEARFRCMNPGCPRRAPDSMYANARGSHEIIMGRVLMSPRHLFKHGVECDECHVLSTTRICPTCHFELPNDVGEVDQRIIAIIGGRATGKTHYIASLVTRLQNEVGKNFNITVHMADDDTRDRWNRDFYTPLFVRKALLRPTLPLSIDQQAKVPLVFRLTFDSGKHRRILNLSFFDSAGEDMNSLATMSAPHYRYICQADGIIFLLDPLQIPALRYQLSGVTLPTLDPNASPEYIVERLYSLFEKVQRLRAHQPVKVPIAFTISKIDALLTAIDKNIEAGSRLRKPSLHQNFIDLAEMRAVDSEVANYLKVWLGANFGKIIAEDFATYSYFAVSSLGEPPDKDNHLTAISPLRVEDPFLWLLYKFGIVKGK